MNEYNIVQPINTLFWPRHLCCPGCVMCNAFVYGTVIPTLTANLLNKNSQMLRSEVLPKFGAYLVVVWSCLHTFIIFFIVANSQMLRLEVLPKFSAYLVVVWMCLHTFHCCQSSWFWTRVKPSISFNSALFLFKDCYPPVIKRGNGKSSSMEVLMGKSLVAMFDYQGVSYLFPNDVSPKHIQPSLSCKTHLLMGYIPWIISQSAHLICLGYHGLPPDSSGFTNPPDSQIGAAHWRTWWVPGECRLRAARHRRLGHG